MANDGAVVIDVMLDSTKAMTEYNKLGSVMSGAGSKIGGALKAGTAAAIAGTAAITARYPRRHLAVGAS